MPNAPTPRAASTGTLRLPSNTRMPVPVARGSSASSLRIAAIDQGTTSSRAVATDPSTRDHEDAPGGALLTKPSR